MGPGPQSGSHRATKPRSSHVQHPSEVRGEMRELITGLTLAVAYTRAASLELIIAIGHR